METINTKPLKSFTQKRGCHIVRRRCLEFIKILKEYGYKNEVPLEEAKRLFFITLGIGDKASIKAYFGSQASRSIRKIQKIARYSTGTFSFKNIELAQEIPQKRGYFELLGLAKFVLRANTWFMVLTDEALVPELFPQHHESSELLSHGEGNKLSIENFSLSSIPIHQGKSVRNRFGGVSPNSIETKTKQTTTYRVRERNEKNSRFLTPNGNEHTEDILKHIKYSSGPEELAILTAKPVDSEPDRAKIKWSDSNE